MNILLIQYEKIWVLLAVILRAKTLYPLKHKPMGNFSFNCIVSYLVSIKVSKEVNIISLL